MTSQPKFPTRRDFLTAAGAATAGALLPSALAATASLPLTGTPQSSRLGEWFDDSLGLPAYHYTGPLRFPNSPAYDGAPMLPDDPFFLLGNYRVTLFAHASGALQLLTGERAWGRMNQDPAADSPNFTGAYRASVTVNGTHFALTGLDAPTAAAATKTFGIGFARYEYDVTPSFSVTSPSPRRRSWTRAPPVFSSKPACTIPAQLRCTSCTKNPCWPIISPSMPPGTKTDMKSPTSLSLPCKSEMP
jgi:hypothetical protein